MSNTEEFNPVAVGVHVDATDVPVGIELDLNGMIVRDDATENGHAVIYFVLNDDDDDTPHTYTACMSLRQFLIATKLVMDDYVEEVRSAFGI